MVVQHSTLPDTAPAVPNGDREPAAIAETNSPDNDTATAPVPVDPAAIGPISNAGEPPVSPLDEVPVILRAVSGLRPHPEADVIPRMSAKQSREFVEDAIERGIQSPLVVTTDGQILGGRMRYESGNGGENDGAADPADKGSGLTSKCAVAIDPEFERLIPLPTAEETEQLEENLLRDGVCHDALKVWKNGRLLLDGHQRLRLCLKHTIPYAVEEIDLADREAARQWLLAHQLGRRNLTSETARYLRGQLYLSMKQQGQRTDLAESTSGQSGHKLTAAAQVSARTGVPERTVRRDAQFAAAVDTIADHCDEDVRGQLLSGRTGLSLEQVVSIAELAPEQQREEVSKAVQKKAGPRTKQKLKKQDRRASRNKDGLAENKGPTSATQNAEEGIEDPSSVLTALVQEGSEGSASDNPRQDRPVGQPPVSSLPQRVSAARALIAECLQEAAALASSLSHEERVEMRRDVTWMTGELQRLLELLDESEEPSEGRLLAGSTAGAA